MTGRMDGKTVLVTGAGGFIPSHLTERLVAEGATVRAMVRYTSRSDIGYLRFAPPEIQQQIEFVFGDLRDSNFVSDAVKGIDIVFHLGASISIPYSYGHPREVIETNVIGTLNVLMAAKEHCPNRVLHTSTSEVYGTAIRVPMDESHPLQGQSPYSASKIGADKMVESFVDSYGMPAVTIRPFNTFGPRQPARAVIPAIISQALMADEVLLGNLSPTRDFTYVDDTVDGFLCAATADGVVGETINLGTGREISIGELVDTIMGLTGRQVKVKNEAIRMRPRASEVDRLLSDNSKAKKTLGWEPQTSLEEGLKQTIAWVKSNPDMFSPGKYAI